MAVEFAVQKLRKKVHRLHREYTALCVIGNMLTVTDRDRFEREKQRFNDLNKHELHPIIQKLEKEIADVRRDFGVRVPNSVLVKLLDKIEAMPADVLPQMNKMWLSEMCSRYGKNWPIFDTLPAHAMIFIDPGTFRTKPGEFSWIWLEALVFEEMCALYNQAFEFVHVLTKKQNDKPTTTTSGALSRATLLTAFRFVEAYLNGLAYDYLASHEGKIDDDMESLLLDWDAKRNRPQFLSLRAKALQYPKIILGLQHPPLDEHNCPELKYVVERTKIMRDRFTHTSPGRELKVALSSDGPSFHEVPFTEMAHAVDSCIELVKKIEKTIYGNTLRLPWLHERPADGVFPAKVFE